MNNLIIDFWYGKISLWRSYWLVGELLNALVLVVVINIDIVLFNNYRFIEKLPSLDFNQFHVLSKFIIIIWTIYITVGIWRSAENYKGHIIWVVLALIVLSYRAFTLRTLFF